jgi:hypothetical protein
MTRSGTASGAFTAAIAASALLIAGLCIYVASQEWFSRDDFALIAMARDAGFSWLEAYLPLETLTWPFYRPVGVQTFFRIGVGLFGLAAFPFLAAIVTVHMATGLWIWRIALQLGFAAPVALVTAVVSVSRHPSLTEIFYGAMFQYVALCFFTAAALSLFLDYSQRRRPGWQIGSCLALALALWCNEAAVTTAAILVLVSWLAHDRSLRGLLATTRRATPQIAITLGYLVLRFGVLAQYQAGSLYRPFLGRHVPRNLAHQLQEFFGGELAMLISALVLLAVLAGSLATSTRRAQAGSWLLFIGAACLGWAVLALAPYTLRRSRSRAGRSSQRRRCPC